VEWNFRERAVLDWVGDKVLAIVGYVPALFVEEGSTKFMLIRAMFGLLLIVLIVYLVAVRPFRSTIARCMRAMSSLITRRP
jgi:hypothetical protein